MRYLLTVLLLSFAIAAAPVRAEPKAGDASEQGAEKSQSTDVPSKTSTSTGAAKSEGTAEGRQTPTEKSAGDGGK